MDGLRGWAAVVVLLNHVAARLFDTVPIATLTPIDGTLAVYVFFVLSGYVLSIGYIKHPDRRYIAALAIRRYPRLTIPILGSSLAAYAMVQMGLMDNIRTILPSGEHWFVALFDAKNSPLTTAAYATWGVYFDQRTPHLNPAFWTMRTELLGSLLVLAVLWISPGRWARIIINAALAGYFVATGDPMVGVVAGTLLADISNRFDQPLPRSIMWPLLLGTFALALIRSGWLATPAGVTILATIIVMATLQVPEIARKMQCRLSQWLGEISFPLYVTHMLVVCSWLPTAALMLRRTELPDSMQTMLVLVSSIALSLALAVAFLPIERLAIRAGRWLSQMVLSPWPIRTAP